MELRLVEEDGTVLADDGTGPDAIGEIQVRGPNLFTGYLNRPDATAAAFTEDGWFRTGDMATRDADGYVRIVGRKATDLIKSGGYKIGAGEIENALLDHPGVREAAVTGEPDPDLGERIVAWVVLSRPGRAAVRGRTGGPCGRPALSAQAPAHGPLPGGAAPQRPRQDHEAVAPWLNG